MTHPARLFLLLVFLVIPLVSSCLRTTNNAPGNFIPDPNKAKTFTSAPTTVATKPHSGESSHEGGSHSGEGGTGRDSGEETTSTSSSTTTTTTRKPHSPPPPHHHHHWHSHSSSHSREDQFHKHMAKYRSLFYSRTYQAKTFATKGDAGGDSRLLRRNESESSAGISLQKPESLDKSKEVAPGFDATDSPVGMCEKCVDITMTSTEDLKKRCGNWKSIEDNFSMNMDSEVPKVKQTYTDSECFKTVKCKQPYAIVRWLDYSMCDVHTASKDLSEFELKCNGTHWTMHGFPVDAVTCAKKYRRG